MSVTPESLAYFRIAVHSQYEAELLKALSVLGKIHLEEPFETRRLLPEYLLEVLEGKVTYASLNVDEALAVARKVLRPGDALLVKIEEKVNLLRRLQKLRVLADRLEALGVQPGEIGKARYGEVIDIIFVKEEDLSSAFSDLIKVGVLARRMRLMPSTYALLLVYTREKASIVEELKKKYGGDFYIPSWFFDKLDAVKGKLDEEEIGARKELVDLLKDTASALRDAIEFERAAQTDVLESAKKAIERVQSLLPKLEEITFKAIALRLAAKLYAGENLDAFMKNIKPDEVRSIIENLLRNKYIELKLAKKVLDRLDAGEDLLKKIFIYNSLKCGITLIPELQPAHHDFLLFACGDKAAEEVVESEILAYENVSVLVNKCSENYHVLVLGGSEGPLRVLEEQLEEKGVTSFLVSPTAKGLKDLENHMTLEFELGKNRVLTALLSLWLRKSKAEIREIFERVGDKEVLDVLTAFERLTIGGPRAPLGSASELLKSVVTYADEVYAGISEISADLDTLSDLPLSAVGGETTSILEKLASLLEDASYVIGNAAQLEVISRVQPLIRRIVLRNRRLVVVEGYVPSREKENLQKLVSENVPNVLYFKVIDVPRHEKAPTYIEARGIWKHLLPLTLMRGIPVYWELNPTPFLVALFSIMYGMMFGDVGQGLLITLFGAWLLKTRYRLLGISEEGAASVGALALLAGASSVAFGALYGFAVFLKPLTHPILSPVHDIYGIIAIALWFGAAQLLLGMTLNAINLLRYGDRLGALFGGMAGMGVLFYLSGVVVAYRLATSGFDFSSLSDPSLQPMLLCIVVSLASVLAFGVYEAKAKGEREKLMHAVSEVMEMIIALPANSLSYIRLAAFAMAHEAFGILAESMGAMFGEAVGFVTANILVLAIETLAVGIQALRLTYYEFSSKFFKGEGVEFRPIIYS